MYFCKLGIPHRDGDCLADDAVGCEPVSGMKFPANREKYREFRAFRPLAPVTARKSAPHFRHLRRNSLLSRTGNFIHGIREFKQRKQAILVGPAKTANPQQVKSGGKHRSPCIWVNQGVFRKIRERGGYQNAITPKWRGQQLRLTGGRATTGETPCCVPSG